MDTPAQTIPAVLERLHQAQNQHDLDAFLACFDPEYQAELDPRDRAGVSVPIHRL
jgi:hypothetical protein